jgi:hypothetical protein
VEWYEHSCPRHGVVVRYSRDDTTPPAIPITCPRAGGDMPDARCGERLRLKIIPFQRGHRLDPNERLYF